MEHLDADQIARLECLKLVQRDSRTRTVAELIESAALLARFVLDGSEPEHSHDDGDSR